MWTPGQCANILPQNAKHAAVQCAELATIHWGLAVMARRPQKLTVVGNSKAFASSSNWFAMLCAAFPEKVSTKQWLRAPWHAVCETLAAALHATASVADVRILAATRNDARAVMEKLRGSSAGVRVGDDVWHWRCGRLGRVLRLTNALGADMQAADIEQMPGLRVHTSHALNVPASHVNVALVQTPATLRGRPNVIIVLPGVPPCHACGADQHASDALIGVGRAFTHK